MPAQLAHALIVEDPQAKSSLPCRHVLVTMEMPGLDGRHLPKLPERVDEPGDLPSPEYDGYREVTTAFIDGNKYDAKDPIGYINSFEIGNKEDEALSKQ